MELKALMEEAERVTRRHVMRKFSSDIVSIICRYLPDACRWEAERYLEEALLDSSEKSDFVILTRMEYRELHEFKRLALESANLAIIRHAIPLHLNEGNKDGQ